MVPRERRGHPHYLGRQPRHRIGSGAPRGRAERKPLYLARRADRSRSGKRRFAVYGVRTRHARTESHFSKSDQKAGQYRRHDGRRRKRYSRAQRSGLRHFRRVGQRGGAQRFAHRPHRQ